MSESSKAHLSSLTTDEHDFVVDKDTRSMPMPISKNSDVSGSPSAATGSYKDAIQRDVSPPDTILLPQKHSLRPATPPPPKRATLGDIGQKRYSEGISLPSVKRPESPSPPSSTVIEDIPSTASNSMIPVAFLEKKPATSSTIVLSNEQKKILTLVMKGDSIFYTGSAGTGKSVLLGEIIKALQDKYADAPGSVAITASTGIAACNIGGVTIHSFAGIGLALESAEELAALISMNKKATARWTGTEVLIIDEVSMVDGELFDKLARIGSIIRRKAEPFGGIQLVVTGDFFQLPPVNNNKRIKFAFEATTWNEVVRRKLTLTKVFRQKDQDFVAMLNELRFGELSQQSIARFRSLSRNIPYEDGIEPTQLFPRRQDVDSANNIRLARLRGDRKTYYAEDSGTAHEEQRKKLLDKFIAPDVLRLAQDAQVMLIKNYDGTLVNGSIGKIARFVDPRSYSKNTADDDKGGENKAELSVETGDSMGESSVATAQRWPVVEFVVPAGRIEVMITPETWRVELPNGEIQASRIQLPLILAWAMSIHKSQGQTLDRVKVDLARVFEKGQAYVALSRATSLDGLQVLNFHPNKVFVHDKVCAWHQTLETVPSDDNGPEL